MINNKTPVSFIIFEDEQDAKTNKISIWVQHAADFQDTYDHCIHLNAKIHSANGHIDTLGEAMALISLSMVCNLADENTEYVIRISGASINQVKHEAVTKPLDV